MVVTRVTPDSAPPRQVNIGAGAWSRPWSDPWSGPWCPRQVNITGANGANQPSQDIAPRSRPWSAVEFSNFDIDDKLLRENYNQYFLLGICPSRLFRTLNEANILLIVYFNNMFDLQSQKLQLEVV